MTTSSQSFSMKARKAGSSGPEAASHQPRSVAAAQVAASVSTPKTRAPGILAASAPANDAPMSPRPMTATAEKGALAPFSSAVQSWECLFPQSIRYQSPPIVYERTALAPKHPPAPHFPHVSPPPQCLTGFRLGLYTDGAGVLGRANGGYLVFKFIAWRSSRFPCLPGAAISLSGPYGQIDHRNNHEDECQQLRPSNHGNLLI